MIIINGRTYNGNNVTINGNKVIIDGQDVTPESKEINIVVNGNINTLSVDSCNSCSVTGRVGSVKTMSGDVDVDGDITGNVSTMSGDVDCNNVGGSVSTMSGDIKTKKA